MVYLRTTEGHIKHINEELAKKSILIRNIIEETTINGPITLLIKEEVLNQICAFTAIDKHVLEPDYDPLEIYFSAEMLDFFREMDNEMLLDVCNAANYLDYPFLLEITCKVIAGRLSNSTRSELVEAIKGGGVYEQTSVDAVTEEFEWFCDPS